MQFTTPVGKNCRHQSHMFITYFSTTTLLFYKENGQLSRRQRSIPHHFLHKHSRKFSPVNMSPFPVMTLKILIHKYRNYINALLHKGRLQKALKLVIQFMTRHIIIQHNAHSRKKKNLINEFALTFRSNVIEIWKKVKSKNTNIVRNEVYNTYVLTISHVIQHIY